MKPLFFFLLLFSISASAQRVVTLDPEKDPIAQRVSDGSIQFIVPIRALTISIQETMPTIVDIQTLGIQKFGKSNYIIASGKSWNKPGTEVSVAILLVETSHGVFQADDLVISCTSAGDCRECSLPPLCKCSKGEGSCGQNAFLATPLKKVTVTLFD